MLVFRCFFVNYKTYLSALHISGAVSHVPPLPHCFTSTLDYVLWNPVSKTQLYFHSSLSRSTIQKDVRNKDMDMQLHRTLDDFNRRGHTLTVRSHVLALRSCTVRTPCHRVLPFPGFFFVAGFTGSVASLRRMRRLLLVIAIQARDTGTWCKEDQRTFRLRIPKHPRTLHNFTVWKLHFWCVFCLEQAKVLTVAEDVESIAESTFTLRGLGGSCWLRFNSTPEVFVQFDTVVVIICCRVVVWCMHSYTKNVSIFCVWLLSKCL